MKAGSSEIRNNLIFKLTATSTGVLLGVLASVMLCGSVLAQEDDPGYVDFGTLDIPFEGESSVEILLRRPLLRMVAESSREEDPEFSELLARLQLIHVQSFPFDADDAEYINERVYRAAERFDRRNDWERVVRVIGRRESSFISLKMDRNRVTGLLLMVVDPKHEVFYVNIVGDIDMAQIGRIGRRFKISQLEDLKVPK